MSTSNVVWLYYIPTALGLGVHVLMLIYIISRRRQSPKAARLATVGVAALLLTQLVGTGAPIVLQRMMDTDSFLLANAIAQIMFSLVRLGGFCLIIAAVFVDRQTAQPYTGFVGEAAPNPVTGGNPYVPPNS